MCSVFIKNAFVFSFFSDRVRIVYMDTEQNFTGNPKEKMMQEIHGIQNLF